MATAADRPMVWKNGYPTTDGKPMAETDWHRNLMVDLIQILKLWYADNPRVYVTGNMLLFYEEGNRRKHKSPDVFVVKGVANYDRPNYLLWEEGKGPDVTIEITSSSTKREDVEEKFQFYRDTLRVKEYFMFDPLGDYLDPPMQGYRLRNGEYRRIRFVDGRLPSQVLRLHLERCGKEMRLYDPLTHRWLPTLLEMSLEAEQGRQRAEAHSRQAEAARQQESETRKEAEIRSRQAEAARQEAEERSRQEAEARQRAEEARRQEAEARQRAEEACRQAEERSRQEAVGRQQEAEGRRQAEERSRQEAEARRLLEAETERLRRELADMHRRTPPSP